MLIKSTTTTRVGIQKNLQSKSKQKNNIFLSWVTAVRVQITAESHSPPHLPRIPSNIVLISGPPVTAVQVLIWSYSYVFFLQLSELGCILLWELSMTFYIFHRHRVCLVDRVDLICSLYSWWEGFGSSSLATLLWVSIVVLFPPLHVGCPLEFPLEAALKDLGLPLWGPGVEVGQLLGSQGFWQHQVLRGVGS